MSEGDNILKSLEYLRQEADAVGDHALSSIIDAALSMAEVANKLKYLTDNKGDEQDILRIMTFIKFYRSAPEYVQRQVYALISAQESQENVESA